jgi:glycosyltransferase involved in cell wall biosynthesis
MPAIKLSAVIITLNEEKNIGRCVDSLLPVVEEFVVLDSFSTDQTISILHEKGIKAVQRKWAGYSNAKNFANTLVTGDFILSIDADEELSPELKQSILEFKQNPRAEVCILNRLTNYCGQWIRHSGWYPEYKVRIFKKNAAEWKGEIHEEIVFQKVSSPVTLTGDLYHYSYPTVESHLNKISKYAYLAAQRDLDSGKRYTLLSHALIKPWFMFMRKFFFQQGFRDGFYGFVIAVISAFERFMRFVHFRQIQKKF